jgi:hypothetical protein
MIARLRVFAALGALVTALVVVIHDPTPVTVSRPDLALRSTGAPMTDASTTIKSPVINLTNPSPFNPCDDIPVDAINNLGLGFTPPEQEDSLRCHYDAGNYQMAVEAIIWRTYEQSLPPDALETTINGHRAAQFWVMKPTDWNNRWWFSCMITFKTSYGVIQQSLFYSPVYSNPDIDCLAENMMRAQQLSPFYKF